MWCIFTIRKKFEDKFHRTALKEQIEHALFRLHTQLERLEQMYGRLHQRDKDLFQRCVGAQASHDLAHAKIYADECAEIRKIAKVILGSQLALEKVILRLEAIEEFGTIMSQMAPVMSIVKETKSKIGGIVPQVATELEEVNEMLGDLTMEAGEVTSTEITVEATDEEAKKILEETGVIAEEKLRDHFPKLPTVESEAARAPEPVAIQITQETGYDGEFEERVYNYVRKHEGELDLHSCAEALGSNPEAVRDAVQKLRDSGKVVIE